MRFSATFFALALSTSVATVVAAPVAHAQDDELLDNEAEDTESADPEGDSSQPTAEDGASVDSSVGGATGFVFKNGLYLTSELGGFFRFGGYGDSTGTACYRCEQKVVSNLQPWVALTLGYDFLKFLGAEVTLGTGFVSDAAPIFQDSQSPENSAITMVNVAVTGSYYIDRFAITGKGFVGGALLTPAPFPDAVPVGGQFGLGVGVRYATLLTNVVIGIDVATYFIVSPDVHTMHIGPVEIGDLPLIPALSFAPVIKYTF